MGAQMIMQSVTHPDIVEFIISKMQNPRILRFLIESTNDPQIKQFAQEKLKFIPFSTEERDMYEEILAMPDAFSEKVVESAKAKLQDGGRYEVNNPEFLSGANISVCVTKEFMEAVEADGDFELSFPDVESYDPETMQAYNEKWHEVGDVREWKAMGYGIKVYRTIKAKELWNLINICATYAAEPGIFFMDNANDMTNAKAYGQKVVASNPCGS